MSKTMKDQTSLFNPAAPNMSGVGATALRVVVIPRPTKTQQCGLACGAHPTYSTLAMAPLHVLNADP
ncbi:hypothetical protein KDA_45170 [Dictyobacter alpinus]|uniref:Uncharacterized protein n=1 Tax=Dictyobacter alpinus TaxID=2014873 RepID=A0A402BCC3_9CHLR|nr:hypothetical protein KDA_45170 [Dictyobacter alpinus]